MLPGTTVCVTGLALNAKLFTVSVTVAVFTSAPLVAVMVTVTAPPGVDSSVAMVIVVVPDPVTGVGANVAVAPAGKPVAAKVTGPENPPRPVTVTVDVVELPAFAAAGGVAARVKSAPTVKLKGGEVTIVFPALASIQKG